MTAHFGYAASALAAIWLAVHFFMGGREVATPLRNAANLPDVVRMTMWMCWHMVTACIAALAILPSAAILSGLPGLMIAALILAIAIAGGGIISQFVLRARFSQLPQGWLFIPVAVLCGLAL